jgi:hypothetical protein
VLTCHGQDGGDLKLSDLVLKRENLVCQVMGGDALFLPIFGEDDADKSVAASAVSLASASDYSESTDRVEESILDHIREMILQAKRHGAWTVGIGGVGEVRLFVFLTNSDAPTNSQSLCNPAILRPVRVICSERTSPHIRAKLRD